MRRVAASLLAVCLLGLVGCEPDEESPVSDLVPEVVWGGFTGLPADRYQTLRCLTVGEGFAYLGLGTQVEIVDVGRPAQPKAVTMFSPAGATTDLVWARGYLYSSSGQSALQIVDVRTQQSPTSAGTWAAAGAVLDLEVVEDLAYLALGASGLQVASLREPSSPLSLITLRGLGEVTDIAVSGNFLLLAAGSTGLQVVDVSQPSIPKQVGSRSTDYAATVVASLGESRCVVGAGRELDVFELANLSSHSSSGHSRCQTSRTPTIES